ncbi:1-acyl-sn-glycerol-3-phosphate acyltransferase [Trypanosoma rangeli]|uniref:1-acyl-sn-glycerol-3-phosphate acyltransferase n=1 Tax=Trypanosoma rangeli TaxID=5698 RepID=A0A3S5IQW0_TRYRA|nr:1-acyl-sn-glycerol-3-phosphate acyltransferase [Trypanosoma rangeli]RNF02723.1 1-acyl-sn-glycerol-3-phosphate acyltransferase [Trypanosoma rangeli]|eukprot:RNF02723.1 1-acyl-sn-glycerol-3-phosphate acyltransferase [Trypanosoma rangeli]
MASSKILRLLVTAYILFLLIIAWIVSWILQVLFMVVTYPFISRCKQQDCCGFIFRCASFLCIDFLNPLWRSHILKPFPRVKGKKVLIMINHLSAADPFLMIRVLFPLDATWIAKNGLFRVPFGGWCMANADDLRVHFVNKRAGFETVKGTVGVMMEEARLKLRRGRPIALFPEGMRNLEPEGGLQPFRLGFFKLAVEEGAMIVPVAISGTQDCWPLFSPLMDQATAYFSCGDAVDASKFKTAEELRDHVWQAITDLRDSHPDRRGKVKQQ